MANVSKMSATNAPEAVPGHAASAFFKMLPPEIRLNIYKKAVQGASVHATLTMEDDPSGGGKQHLVRFRHSKHFNLLRRCRKIYDEALPTYWSETTLHIVTLRTIEASRAASVQWLWDAKYTADDYSYHLCNSLPEVVKGNVKHVRGMMLPPLHGKFVKKNPELTPTAMLSGFKSLATCDISPTMLRHPKVSRIRAYNIRSIIEHESGTNSEGNNEGNTENDSTDSLTRDRGRFKTLLDHVSYEPKEVLRKIWGIDATCEVVFLTKDQVFIEAVQLVPAPPGLHAALTAFAYGVSDNMPDIPSPVTIRSQTLNQFWNFSAGIFCEVDPKTVTDEEGFDMVVQGRPEFEVAGDQTTWG